MKVLVAAIYGVASYSRGVMADVLQEQLNSQPDNDYYYISCSRTFKTCYYNSTSLRSRCAACEYSVSNIAELVEGRFSRLRIADIIDADDYKIVEDFFRQNSVLSRSLKYDNFEVGEATLSTYISITRDKELELIGNSPFANELAFNCLLTYIAIRRFMKDNGIRYVYNFNGRQDYLRAIFRASESLGITCMNVERARPGGYIEFYENCLPHSIKAKKKLIEDFWEGSIDSFEDKVAIASKFFERKRSGLETISRVYTGSQEQNYFPQELITERLNIVLFNSSDDEHAAVGDEYQNPFFENQNEGIKFLVDLLGTELTEFNLVIRMHPNLATADFDYMRSIVSLHQKYPNIFVFDPKSKVDTYALMDAAFKVVTFGSTAGLEASFVGKPVILLGKGRYYYSDVAYLPKDKTDIANLLRKELPPKDQVNSLKFGYYYTKGGVETKFYSQRAVFSESSFKGRRLNYFSTLQRLRIFLLRLMEKFNAVARS